jgi:hypothetical protein
MDKQKAADVLKKQLDIAASFKEINPDNPDFELWMENCLTLFKELFPEEKNWQYNFSLSAFRVNRIKMAEEVGLFTEKDKEAYLKGLQRAETTIKAALNKLELFGFKPTLPDSRLAKNGLTVQITNSLSNQQSVNLSVSFEQIIEIIDQTQSTNEEKVEAKSKVNELKEEINKENPSWDKVKGVLIWLINFSKEVFLKVLPYILDKYGFTQ